MITPGIPHPTRTQRAIGAIVEQWFLALAVLAVVFGTGWLIATIAIDVAEVLLSGDVDPWAWMALVRYA